VGYQRIAVVCSFLDKVEFVAILGSHLVGPESSLSVKGHAQDIAMTQGPDLSRNRALIGKGIIVRDAAVVVEAHDLAEVALQILGGIKLLAFTGADPEHAVVIEGYAIAEVAVACRLGRLTPDHFEIFQRAAALIIQGE